MAFIGHYRDWVIPIHTVSPWNGTDQNTFAGVHQRKMSNYMMHEIQIAAPSMKRLTLTEIETIPPELAAYIVRDNVDGNPGYDVLNMVIFGDTEVEGTPENRLLWKEKLKEYEERILNEYILKPWFRFRKNSIIFSKDENSYHPAPLSALESTNPYVKPTEVKNEIPGPSKPAELDEATLIERAVENERLLNLSKKSHPTVWDEDNDAAKYLAEVDQEIASFEEEATRQQHYEKIEVCGSGGGGKPTVHKVKEGPKPSVQEAPRRNARSKQAAAKLRRTESEKKAQTLKGKIESFPKDPGKNVRSFLRDPGRLGSGTGVVGKTVPKKEDG